MHQGKGAEVEEDEYAEIEGDSRPSGGIARQEAREKQKNVPSDVLESKGNRGVGDGIKDAFFIDKEAEDAGDNGDDEINEIDDAYA